MLPPAPKFDKTVHHVVPAFWQKQFGAAGLPGPFYLDVQTGRKLQAQGPGDKMAEPFANIVFDEHFRPSDAFEDQLSALETKMASGLARVIASDEIDSVSRCDVAMLLAVQAGRYPERFASRLDLGKYLAIALADGPHLVDANALNRHLQSTGMLPGAAITDADFARLQAASPAQIAAELDHILGLHGYEAHFNPSLIIKGAMQAAEHLLALEWQLIRAPAPCFILSDRPVPATLGHGFALALGAAHALQLSYPSATVSEETIKARAPAAGEIDAINAEVRSRAHRLICGPGAWVHQL